MIQYILVIVVTFSWSFMLSLPSTIKNLCRSNRKGKGRGRGERERGEGEGRGRGERERGEGEERGRISRKRESIEGE